MSISSSVQQISGGVGAIIAGMIVVKSDSGPVQNFDVVSNITASTTLITILLMYQIQKRLARGGYSK